MLGFIHWNPCRELFTLPIINWPVMWYGFFFSLGFFLGYFVFLQVLKRYFLETPYFTDLDILEKKPLISHLQKWFSFEEMGKKKSSSEILKYLLEKDKPYESLYAKLGPSLQKQIQQVKKDRFLTFPKLAMNRLIMDRFFSPYLLSIHKKAAKIADRLLFYVVLGTIIGAKLGHFVFYESPSKYLLHPWELFQGNGFASHGAVIGIMVASYFFVKWVKKVHVIHWVTLLDLMSLPALLIAGFIRLGNFFNQEILGKPSSLPWAIVFDSPFDGSKPLPRHPAQLYEALFYFGMFFLLKWLIRKPKVFSQKGKIAGILLTSVFSFRFFVEFFKEEQSSFFSTFLNMGQVLSLPLILWGSYLLFSFSKEKWKQVKS